MLRALNHAFDAKMLLGDLHQIVAACLYLHPFARSKVMFQQGFGQTYQTIRAQFQSGEVDSWLLRGYPLMMLLNDPGHSEHA